MKVKKKAKSGSVKIAPNVLAEAKKICKDSGVLISFYVTEVVKEKNDGMPVYNTIKE